MIVRCPSTNCAFNTDEGLPVHLVDEAVYNAHPTLVIATVDKFASIPWRPTTAALLLLIGTPTGTVPGYFQHLA